MSLIHLPIVSIVGRPNVGKSSLFNRIVRQKIAVVDDMPGVTRDRNYMEASWCGQLFVLADTGGLIPTAKDSIPVEIHKQVAIAVEESAAIIFLVDGLVAPTDFDLLIAQHLRKKCPEKVVLTVNKTESHEARHEAQQYRQLGCGEPLCISALHGFGVGDLLDAVKERIVINKPAVISEQLETAASIAITGRPNAGKSSLVNKLLKDERMIVDTIPGTTRDAVDSFIIHQGQRLRLIDTAGLRKKAQVHDTVEYYANLRALDAIKRSDICLLLIDTAQDIGEQDCKILRQIQKYRKGTVVCWNKWDSVHKDEKTFDKLVAETKKRYKEMRYMPMISISALTGQRVGVILDTALAVKNRMEKRITPPLLRQNFFDWVKTTPHPFIASKQVRFLGIKQQPVNHPHFSVFCTNSDIIQPSYIRFLTNKFQDTFDFSGCPVVLDFRKPGIEK